MAVGYGDAGAEIIADNMRSGGDLNPLVPGQKVMAIFGFCDVRQFTDTTEILQVSRNLFLWNQKYLYHDRRSVNGCPRCGNFHSTFYRGLDLAACN